MIESKGDYVDLDEENPLRRILKANKKSGFQDFYKADESVGPDIPNENLFFFTDQEYFSSERHEYLSHKSASKGFIFGLFEPDQTLNNVSI